MILLSVTDPLALAWQRFAGTALGAVAGRPDRHVPVHANWMVYGAGILVCGILSALLRLGSAYRFAAITLTIVLLIAHAASALGRRLSPLRGSVARNRGGAAGHNGMAAAAAEVGQDIDCAPGAKCHPAHCQDAIKSAS